ncbi:hypothetical protein, partial [Vreelandella lionensis]|uniref:hypothetical protein n=1 Tax=Vreelandella lionensis TaxID=1144478 RepID=UPI001A9E8FA7
RGPVSRIQVYEMYNSDDAAKFETAKQKYIDYVQKLTVQEFFISTKEDLMAIALDCQYHNKDKLKHVLD